MGQKVNPIGIRLGIIKGWKSNWFAKGKEYSDTLCKDIQIRQYLEKELAHASVSQVEIARTVRNSVKITIHTARPGIIIGKKGEDVERLRLAVVKILGKGFTVQINISEIRKPDLDATLVAQTVAQQLEKRVMFRRAMKRAVANAKRAGAEGIKIKVSGRLAGAEIARSEWYREGRVPLHTLRADIDYGTAEAKTTYGIIGVKVWICRGEVLDSKEQKAAAGELENASAAPAA